MYGQDTEFVMVVILVAGILLAIAGIIEHIRGR